MLISVAVLLVVAATAPHQSAWGFVNNPKIITQDGNLIFESGLNRNISFRLSGNSRININDEYDLLDLVFLNKKRQNGPNGGVWSEEDDTQRTKLTELTATVKTLKDIVFHAIEPRVSRLLNRSRTANAQRRRYETRLADVDSKVRVLYERLEKDNCVSTPCENGGKCFNMFTNYICKCEKNFEGANCEKDVNECALYSGTDLGCQNGAQCVNQFGGYSCICSQGWFGIHCTQRKADCMQSSAWELCGHGICVGSSNSFGYKCICDQGWKTNGLTPACSVDVDECVESHPRCATHCINLPGSFTCAPCTAGLTGNGIACRDIDECATQNGGCSVSPRVTCINSYGSHHCGECPLGWTGDGRTCQRSSTDQNGQSTGCTGVNICHPEATCREISNTVVCTCPAGKIGSGIGLNGCIAGTALKCDALPCLNGGTCIDNGIGYTCLCPVGYRAPNCKPLPGPCLPNPCRNNGRCRVYSAMSFQCQCQPGYRGHQCEIATSRCGGVLSGTSGRLKYPEGSLYDHNAQCAWVIRTEESNVLNVTFQAFQLEDASECRFDFLQINDGRTAAAQIIGRFCGSRKPMDGNIISTTNNLYLWFKSDNSTAKEGFDLEWSSIPPQCGGLIEVTTHGTIATPGSPGNYPKNRDCQWQLRAPNNKRLKLTFFRMQLEIHDTCNYDYVEVKDTISDLLLEKFCNTSTPAPLLLPTNEATIHFHSDNIGSDAGFQIYYSTEERIPGCGGTFSLKEGIIQAPLFTRDAISCEYDIQMAIGESIRIDFLKFEMGQEDCIEFYDVNVEKKIHSLQGKFCGGYEAAPVSLHSLYNAMQIRYFSTGGKFELKYRADCSYTFESDTDVILSPRYPELKSAERFCAYKIITDPNTVISVNVVDFDLKESSGEDSDCTFTSLIINDGLDKNSMGPYCANNTPPLEFISKTNMLVFNFQSSDNGYGRGFKIEYRAIPMGKTDCGGVFTKPGFSIRSPNDDEGKYLHDMECYWIIMAPANKSIMLNFKSFTMETSSDCYYDYIEIYDTLATNNEKSLGRFCETPPSFVSYSRVLTIKFVSDFSESRDGFEATYDFIDKNACGGEIWSSTGQIYSPQWPRNYTNGLDCRWTLTAPQGRQMELKIDMFELEESQNCSADWLEIRNGGSERSPVIGSYCGKTIPRVIPSFTNQLRIHFHSDSFLNARGFRLEWYAFANGCGGILKGDRGVITSPLYPNAYPQNAECEWRIYVHKGSSIHFIIDDVELETMMSCFYDHLDIIDGRTDADPILARICDQSPDMPKHYVTSSNEALIRFQTDGSNSFRGFMISYYSNCTLTLTDMYGVIESPNFGNPRSTLDINCSWTIKAPKGNSIALEFSYYENSDRAAKVYVSENVKNRTISHDVSTRHSITSTGDTLVITQNSSSVSFRLEYSMVGCIEVFQRESGSFESPNYPKSYPNDVECFWKIKTDPGKGIELTVHDMDIEESANCTMDALQISSHPHSNNYKERHCGKQQIVIITSSAHRMYVRFTTNHEHNGKGFSASYRTMESPCGGLFSSRTGIIQSPHYPLSYPPNADCEWIIEVQDHHSITFTMEEIDLEDSILEECEFDYVEAVEVLESEESERQIFQKCSDELEGVTEWKSRTNIATVRFKSDDSYEKKGFKLSFREDCGEHITLDEETVGYLFTDRNTFSNETCEWQLVAKDPSKHVSLTITNVQLTPIMAMAPKSESDCSEIGVKVYDGVDDRAPLRNKFCKTHPPTIISNGHALTIKVPRETIAEFDTQYSLMDTLCGTLYRAISGKFASPLYPASYPVNMDCNWLIDTSEGNSIVFTIEWMSLEESEECNKDYLEVREEDERGRLLGLFCGKAIPPPIEGANRLWIRFSSDGDNVNAGFLASYNYATHNEINGTEGVIESPNNPTRFHSEEPYSWRITVDKEYVVLLMIKYIIDINIPYIKFYDGYSDIGAEIDYAETHVVRSNTNILLLKAKRGPFRFEWERLSKEAVRSNRTAEEFAKICGRAVIVINSTLRFTSPGYPDGYGPNMNCNWTMIPSNRAEHIVVQMTTVDLEDYTNCLADYVRVLASNDMLTWRQLDKLCKSPTLASKRYHGTPYLMLEFVTDTSVSKSGFATFVQTECGSELTDRSGFVNITLTRGRMVYEMNCVWTIRVRQSRRIRITFIDSYLSNENTTTNCRSYFMVRNGINEDSPFLGKGRYCENNITDVLETTSNRAHIKFVRSGFPRFRASFHYEEISHKCSDDISLSDETDLDRLKVITSPNYPNIANPHSECIWKISAPIHHVITVDFEGIFNLATGSNAETCDREYVQLNDGSTELMPLIGKYCGTVKPNSITSTGNMLRMKYFTDIAEPHAGFKANVSVGRCGGSYYASEGTISSPSNLPRQVPNDFECIYTIATEVGSTIKLDVEKLKLPDASVCSEVTHLELTEVDIQPDGENVTDTLLICGTDRRQYIVETNKLIIRFKVKGATQGELFKINYSAIGSRCGETIVASIGILQTPGYPNGVRKPTHCTWRLRAPKGKRIKIEFLDFDTGAIVNDTNAFGHVRAHFHGRISFANDFQMLSIIARIWDNPPQFLYSTDNTMGIEAFLLSFGRHRGFKLRFTALEDSTSCRNTFQSTLQIQMLGNNETDTYCSYSLNVDTNHTLALHVDKYEHSEGRFFDTPMTSLCSIFSPLRLELTPLNNERLLPQLLCNNATQPSVLLPFPTTLSLLGNKRNKLHEIVVSYELYKCGGIMPLYPNHFTITLPQMDASTGKLECAWAVWPMYEDDMDDLDSYMSSEQIELSLSTNLTGNCADEYLLLYNGPNQNAPHLGRYCQKASATNLVIERGVFFEYHTKRYDSQSNFNVTVKRGSGCGGTIAYPYRDIEFSEQYQNNVECIWEIHTTPGFHLGLTLIDRFFIESSSDCRKDYLKVQQIAPNGDWVDVRKLCGREPPAAVNTTTASMRLIFHSDNETVGDGFRAHFERNCGGILYATKDIQQVSSPGYPDRYEHLLHCSYTFVAKDNSSAIDVRFVDFELEEPPMGKCVFDNVTVRADDGEYYGNTETVICGVKNNREFRAKKSITVVLRTDQSYTSKGFLAEYSTNVCGGLITNSSIIETPHQHADDNFPPNSICYWNLTAPEGFKIHLKFAHIDYEGSSQCSYDGVEIYKGLVPVDDQRLGKFCGNLTGTLPVLNIPSNTALIHSYSDSRDGSKGFRVLVDFLPNCDKQFFLGKENSTYDFTNFAYSNMMDCTYVFTTTPDRQLKIVFSSFHLEESTNCVDDYLMVRDGGGPFAEVIGQFCGHIIPAELVSTRNAVYMRFVSDSQVVSHGFAAQILSTPLICGQPIVEISPDKTVVVKSPEGVAGKYPKNIKCFWRLKSESTIHLQFTKMDIAVPTTNGTCGSDYLKIYNGEDADEIEKGFGKEVVFSGRDGRFEFSNFATEHVYCGDRLPDEYFSSTKQLFIRFQSDDAATRTGFSLNAMAVKGCFRNFTGTQGRVVIAGTQDHCDIYIKAPQNYSLSLYFANLVFAEYSCDNEYLEVFDTRTNSSLQKLCTYIEPGKSVFSSSNELRLRLKMSSFYTEFDMTYLASRDGPGCGGDLYNTAGLITNPFYPNNVRNNSDCRWNIRVPSNVHVLLKFLTFNMGAKSTCHSDYLQIIDHNDDGTETVARQFCGEDQPVAYKSARSYVSVRFHKTMNYDGTGWAIRFNGVNANYKVYEDDNNNYLWNAWKV